MPLVGELWEVVERRWRAREHRMPRGGAVLSPYVFQHAGRPLGTFRKMWRRACALASVPSLLFHDLRRSAVRNMDRAGVSPVVAMGITGHKTDAVYRRYRIVDERDRTAALERTQASIKQIATGNVSRLRAHGDGGR